MGSSIKEDTKKFLTEEKVKSIDRILEAQRKYFAQHKGDSPESRIIMLKRFKSSIIKNKARLLGGLLADLGKPFAEGEATEIMMVLSEINYLIKHLKKLAKTEYLPSSILNFPAYSMLYKEPLGNVLIISPWNYPLQLAFLPLAGAIAGGNTVILRFSKLTPYTNEVMREVIEDSFTMDQVAVVSGDRHVTGYLIEEGVDHIFFTGSTATGREIARQAANNLTPITLELGGKSPCIVDETVNLKVAAKRIAWGKLINAGQTCVAPDYVLVHRDLKDDLVKHLIKAIESIYGEHALQNNDYCKIISTDQLCRLQNLLSCGKILYGGQVDMEKRKLEPTIIASPDLGSDLMTEEIFGPILPIITYDDITDAVSFVNSRPKPLALYLFSTNKYRQRYVLTNTSFGGACINDTVSHLAEDRLPFGGIGTSGMGRYHGKHSFETFTHSKPVLYKGTWLDLPFRYAPYGGVIEGVLKVFSR